MKSSSNGTRAGRTGKRPRQVDKSDFDRLPPELRQKLIDVAIMALEEVNRRISEGSEENPHVDGEGVPHVDDPER